MPEGLTAAKIVETMSMIRAVPALPRIVFTATALAATTERLFPESHNRSARIRKKLIKRFGSEFRMEPAIWQARDVIYAHPSFRARFERQFSERLDGDMAMSLYRGSSVDDQLLEFRHDLTAKIAKAFGA